MPSTSFETQIEENNKEIALKKLSNEIILGKTTENTAMELDAKGGASFEQLQELIKKECDKQDKKYRFLERKYNKLQESFEHSQQQKNRFLNIRNSKKHAYEGPMRRLKQKEITTDKPAKGEQPMRSLRFATTPLTTCRTKRKSRRYQQRRNK